MRVDGLFLDEFGFVPLDRTRDHLDNAWLCVEERGSDELWQVGVHECRR